MRPIPSSHYRPDIDGLRAIAVISVIAHHAYPAVFRGGYIGVDIFFVISGYLITRIITTEMSGNSFSLAKFYAKRVRRIFPALLVVMLSTFLLGFFILFGSEFSQLGKHMAGGASFTSNILLMSEAGYFDTSSEHKPLLHLWSLGVEEQFYIAWPFMLWLLYHSNLRCLVMSLTLFGLSMAYNIFLVISQQDSTDFYSPMSRFWELMAGGILASTYLSNIFQENTWRREVASIAGLLSIITALIIIKGHQSYPGYRALLPVIGSCLIIAGGSRSFINRNILATPGLVWLGLISYPLYLWHWPALVFLGFMEADQNISTQKPMMILFTVILASVTYYCIERPLQNLNEKKKHSLTLLLVFMMSSLLLLGLLTMENKGFPERKANQVAIEFDLDNVNPLLNNSNNILNCKDLLAPIGLKNEEESCWQNSHQPEIMVLGDSHASAFLRAAWAEHPELKILLYRKTSCPFLNNIPHQNSLGWERKECRALGENALLIAKHLASIKKILLVSRGPFYFEGTDFGAHGLEMGSPLHDPINGRILDGFEADAAFLEGYNHLIQSLTNLGKEVILISEWPELNFEPSSCLHRLITIIENRKNCTISRNQVDQRQSHYWHLLKNISEANPKLKLFDSRNAFCDKSTCYAKQGERILYTDDDHINIAGSEKLLSEFIPWMIKTSAASPAH